jgi:hypothetical protein
MNLGENAGILSFAPFLLKPSTQKLRQDDKNKTFFFWQLDKSWQELGYEEGGGEKVGSA